MLKKKMFRQIKFESLFVQFLIGLLINLSYLLILIFMKKFIFHDLYIYYYKVESDFNSYVIPAKNFLTHGFFCGYFRTIGYPFILAIMMKLFNGHWLFFTALAQAILAAVIYPCISYIAMVFFPSNKSLIKILFVITLISGTYFLSLPLILTDLPFAVFLLIGICFSVLAIKKQNWIYLLLQLFFLGIATQVRPLLMVYPIINFFLLITIAGKNQILDKSKILIIVSTIALIPICLAPSIRNYVYYGLFKPSFVLDYNLTCLAGQVLEEEKGINFREQYAGKLLEIEPVTEKIKAMHDFAYPVFAAYPITTVKYIIYHVLNISIQTSYIQIAHFGNYHWRNVPQFGIKTNIFIQTIFIIGAIYYFIIYLFFILALFDLFIKKEFLCLITIFLFLLFLFSPAFISGGGFRMRMPVEWLINIFAVNQMITCYFKWFSKKLIV
ncbi:MAG: glycosyltransferase family 39 protein [Candidatus Margulisiibacteriota bacterium]|jgi:hypothetical protein